MKIPPYATASFLENDHFKYDGVLIYGPNYGLVMHSVRKIKEKYEKVKEWNIFRISYDICKDDASQLLEWMQGRSLFDDASQKKLIIIEEVSAAMNASFKQVLESNKNSCFLLLYGQELISSSPLRQYFEKTAHMGSIACYKEEGEALHKTITMLLKKQGLAVSSSEVMQHLKEYCYGLDYGSLESECEKLSLYMGDRKKIESIDVMRSFSSVSESNMENFCLALFDDSQKNIDTYKEKLYLSGSYPVTFLRAILRYILRLLTVKGLMDEEGRPEKEAFSALKPPLFFKNIPSFRKHLSLLKTTEYIELIKKVNDAELECKQGKSDPYKILNHILLEIGVLIKEKRAP